MTTSNLRSPLVLLVALAACPGDSSDGGDGGSSSTVGTTAGIEETSSGAPPTTSSPPTTTGGGESATTTPASTTDDTTATGTTGGAVACAGTFPAAWQDGLDCGAEDAWQVHAYDDDTVILRQSLCSNFEGPFVYLLFGEQQVLLQDTGTGHVPLAPVVYQVIDDWLTANGRTSIELVVTNSHAHGDHVGNNGEFVGQPDTTVVGYTQADISAYFGIRSWPDEVVNHDLGGRMLDIIPIPGHQADHIAIYDHGTGLLLTGDTLYPGRLYISSFGDYVDSVHRLVDHIEGLEVCHVLGTHIEMTSMAGVDFPFGADQHPDEHALPLTRDHLVELRDAVDAMGGVPMVEVHDDFIVYPL